MSVPHLEMMQHYANVICVKYPEEPWKRVEYCYPDVANGWAVCTDHPRWDEFAQYRFLPAIITINGIEVPEPIRVEPEPDTPVWSGIPAGLLPARYMHFYTPEFVQHKWLFENGLLHDNEAAAQAHLDAICAASKPQEAKQ